MPKPLKRSSLVGTGCLLQTLGLLSLLFAVLTLATVIGPIVLAPLGIWLLIFGSGKSKWYECPQCGTRLANRKVVTCPACKASLE